MFIDTVQCHCIAIYESMFSALCSAQFSFWSYRLMLCALAILCDIYKCFYVLIQDLITTVDQAPRLGMAATLQRLH